MNGIWCCTCLRCTFTPEQLSVLQIKAPVSPYIALDGRCGWASDNLRNQCSQSSILKPTKMRFVICREVRRRESTFNAILPEPKLSCVVADNHWQDNAIEENDCAEIIKCESSAEVFLRLRHSLNSRCSFTLFKAFSYPLLVSCAQAAPCRLKPNKKLLWPYLDVIHVHYLRIKLYPSQPLCDSPRSCQSNRYNMVKLELPAGRF